jgi:hypothetical protein
MSKKAVSQIPQVRHNIYRIPTRAVFKAKHPLGPTWTEVYGKARCIRCHKLFQEGDVYEDVTISGSKKLRCQHVECPK